MDAYAISNMRTKESIVRYIVALATIMHALYRNSPYLVDPSYDAMKILEYAWDIAGMARITMSIHEYQSIVGFRQNAKVAAEDVIRFALPVLKSACGPNDARVFKSFDYKRVMNDRELRNRLYNCAVKIKDDINNLVVHINGKPLNLDEIISSAY